MTIVNLTNFEAAHAVTMGLDGNWQVIAVVKATYTWDKSGTVCPAPSSPIVMLDEFFGDPASSGLLRAGDIGRRWSRGTTGRGSHRPGSRWRRASPWRRSGTGYIGFGGSGPRRQRPDREDRTTFAWSRSRCASPWREAGWTFAQQVYEC